MVVTGKLELVNFDFRRRAEVAELVAGVSGVKVLSAEESLKIEVKLGMDTLRNLVDVLEMVNF